VSGRNGGGEFILNVATLYLIAKHLRAAGGEKGWLHLIQYACAQHHLEGGPDIRYIQKLLGNAS
jgi:site-specific recombinase XerD